MYSLVFALFCFIRYLKSHSSTSSKTFNCSLLKLVVVRGIFCVLFLDDEESADAEDVLSRQAIKMHAQQIIDSKNKKHKPRKNKRKTK